MGTPPVALEDLLAALSDTNYKVRRDAVNGLGKYKTYHHDLRVTPALIQATKDSTRTVVYAAIRALDKVHDPSGLEALPNILKSPHVCKLERLLEKWVRGHGQTAVPYLIHAMQSPKPEARRRILWLLDELHAVESFDVFIEALRDPDHTVQACAISRLPNLRDKRAVEPLLNILHSDEFDLPANAAQAIGRLLGIEAADLLLPGLQHRAAKVRASVVMALSNYCARDQRVPPAVAELFNDKNLDVRIAVLYFFGSHPSHTGKSLLISALNDRELKIRLGAVNGLTRFLPDGETGDVLRQILTSDPDPAVKAAIVFALSTTLTPADIPLLTAVFEQRSKEIEGEAAKDHLSRLTSTILQLLRGETPTLPFYPPRRGKFVPDPV